MKDINMRGCLTDRLREKYGINETELRLLPYIHYCATNYMPIDPAKISPEEREILSGWKKKGWIDYRLNHPISLSKDFYELICDVMWDSYVLELEN